MWNIGKSGCVGQVAEMVAHAAVSPPSTTSAPAFHAPSAHLQQIARADQLEDSTRQLAAEFLVTLCEARDKAPGMMRKLPNFVPNLFETLMMFLMDIVDEQLWHGADNDQHEDEGAGDRFQLGQVRGCGGWERV